MSDAAAPVAHPLFVRLAGEPVVVVGGGTVAERKVRSLLASGAAITVVSPEATDAITEWARSGAISWRARPYQPGDAAGARLVYAATGHADVNEAVRAEAVAARAWVNVADEPELCDFFVPAVVRRGRLTIAISTSGASPMLARAIREELERRFGPEYEDAIEELGEIRERARREGRPIADEHAMFRQIIERLRARAAARDA